MNWNFNMDEAPRGHTEIRQRTVKNGAVAEYEHHVPAQIIAAGNDGVVTISRWLPKEGRWNMFSKDTPPMAWQPWPDHPEKTND